MVKFFFFYQRQLRETRISKIPIRLWKIMKILQSVTFHYFALKYILVNCTQNNSCFSCLNFDTEVTILM